MVQLGNMVIPLLTEDLKIDKVEKGDVPKKSAGNNKEFTKHTPYLIFFYICTEFACLAYISNCSQDNSWESCYVAVSLFCLAMLSVTLPDQNEILPMNTFAKPWACLICFVQICFGTAVMFLVAPERTILAIAMNMLTFCLLTYLSSHFDVCDYKPFVNNDKYAISRIIYKSCDGLKFVESRSFHIVLENTGKQVIPFTCLSIERLVVSKTGRGFVKFQLPRFSEINPGQKILLFPETENNTMSALAIPGFRCFGSDRGDVVTTKLTNGNKIISLMEEHFEYLKDPSSGNKFHSVTEVVHGVEGLKTVQLK